MSSTDSPENADQKVSVVLKQPSSSQHKPVDSQPSLQLSISSEKSEDSLDSGVFTREKFCDSMESLNSIESGINGSEKTIGMKRVASIDEVIPPLPVLQYEDYIRECQDIQRSIIIRNKEEGRMNLSRSNSFDEQHDEDNAAEWLQLAGLSDLVVDPSLPKPGKVATRDSLSSMTVLLTLTRPQREAVLRRISSFNRKKQNTKNSKPSITTVFPSVELSSSQTAPDSSFSPSVDDDVENIKPAASEDDVTTSIQSKTSDEETSACRQVKTKQRPCSAYQSQESIPENCESHGGFVEPGEVDEAKYRVQSASTESLPSSSMPAIKPTFDITPRSSFSIPRKRGSGLINLRDSMCASLPDLNAPQETASDKLESASDTAGTLKNSPAISLVSSDDGLTMDANPILKHRSGSVELDRSQKALSDAPSEFDSLSTLPPTSATRLLLQSDGKEEKISRFKRSSKRSSIKSSSLFKFNASRRSIERSRRAASQQNKKTLSNYPEIKQPFMVATMGYSTVKPRAAPLNIPLFQSKNKQSPLRKLSSMSFSTLRSPPKRTGSYKLKQSASSPRRSLRRSRSLKMRDKPGVSLVSMKMSSESSPIASKRLLTKAPSIETLSISSTRSDSISWKSNKDEVSTDDDNFPVKRKGMSFSAEAAAQDYLPDYSLVRDNLGITKISDLSPHDIRKVQSLALIELTALFDLKSIELKRRKNGKSKQKDPGVFGSSLSTLVEWDCKRGHTNDFVPCVFSEIIFFLEKHALQVEGILRKSGSATRIKALKQNIDMRFGPNVSSDALPPSGKAWSDAHPHDVAALLKQFLRDLQDPLLSSEYIHAFQSCRLISDRKEQLQALNLLIILLDPVHRDSLKFLLRFLARVVANEQQNKMSLSNVAMIVAPNLFINTRKSKRDQIVAQDLKLAAGTSNIVRMLIKYHKLLWTVPAFMLTQVRRMNKAETGSKKSIGPSKDKLKTKLFQAGRKESIKNISFVQQIAQPFDYDTPKNLIRVQAPNMNLTSIAVQVVEQLTASDVLDKYRRQCERMKQIGNDQRDQINNTNYALYEVGGNIHERCLDPSANIASVLAVNPDVTWFIRRRKER